MKKINYLTIISIVILSIGCSKKLENNNQQNEIFVKSFIAKKVYFQDAVSETGIVKGIQESIIYPKVASKQIIKVLVDEGARVKKDQLLAILEHEYALKQLEAQKALIESIGANLKSLEYQQDMLKKDKERIENLYKKGVIGQQQLDHITSQLNSLNMQIESVKAQLQQGESTLEYMKKMLENHFIKAPFDGIITRIFLKEGSYTDMMLQKPFCSIASEGKLLVSANISEEYINQVKEGQEGEVILDIMPNKEIKGRVYRVSGDIDKISRTFAVDLILDKAEADIKPGMTAKVRIITGKHKAIGIPYGAVQRYPATGVYYAFVIKGGMIEQKNIKAGQIRGDLIEVIDGIEEGEKVILSANRRIVSGMRAKEVKEGTEKGL